MLVLEIKSEELIDTVDGVIEASNKNHLMAEFIARMARYTVPGETIGREDKELWVSGSYHCILGELLMTLRNHYHEEDMGGAITLANLDRKLRDKVEVEPYL